MRLSREDVHAYQAVIAARRLPPGDPAHGRAWQAATEVPVAVAECCHRLLDELAGVLCQCWPGVCIDYQIGSELLGAGARGGRLAAEANLGDWGPVPEAEPLRARVEDLLQAESRLSGA
jgi:formiminotetrahydrofolate cyclodeaminase